MEDPAAAALAVNQAMLALGNEAFEAEGATFVRNRAAPLIRDANHVTNIRASTLEEIERLLTRAEQEYGGWCPHRRFDIDYRTPPQFEARLALEGYQRSEALVMLAEGELRGRAKPHDIRPITDEAGWADFAALREMDWRAYTERLGRPYDEGEAEALAQMIESARSKAPAVQFWLAYVEGEPRAYMCSWGGMEGVGQVEDLFTHPDFRHRGLATALVHHCAADCRAHGAGPVVIVADPTDTPKQMYAAMGFRPVAIKREYRKTVER